MSSIVGSSEHRDDHRPGYQRQWRRMLVDLEIPAWDESFLSRFDPEHMAELYVRAGANAVMLPCKNLSGWLFWQMPDGPVHPRIGARDIVEETTRVATDRGLEVCAYFSAVYDNQPFHAHPEWRFVPAQGWARTGTVHDRHGLCCPNSAGYRAYLERQIQDLFTRFEFDCAFVDMTFWPGVCVCVNCRARLAASDGIEIPERIDWTDHGWTTFQRHREEWIVEFQTFVTDAIKAASPGIAVYHNFAPAPGDWWRSLPFDTTAAQDFLGGDLYGDETEQLLVMKLMRNLSRTQPVEYMTFGTHSYADHVELKSDADLREHVLSAAAESVASLFIEAVDPVGTVNDMSYDHIGRALRARDGFDRPQPDSAVEDVALYFSSDSKFDFGSQGTPLRDVVPAPGRYPHLESLRGAARALQRSHTQFGVITRKQLDELDRYPVVVLANVHRMTRAEVDAVRAYVDGGGRLYASAYTSLLESDGTLHADYMLADVFGVSLVEESSARIAYLRPEERGVRDAAAPQSYLSHRFGANTLAGGLMRVRTAAECTRLGGLVLPFANPAPGHHSADDWASIHTLPPWTDTGEACLVRHRYGKGEVIFSALPIEVGASEAAQRVFVELIRSLLGDHRLVTIDSDPHVRASVFASAAGEQLRIVLLNHPQRVIGPTTVRIAHPAGRAVASVTERRSGMGIEARPGGSGAHEVTVTDPFEYVELLVRFGAGG